MLLRAISPNDPVTALALQALDQRAPILRDAEWRRKGGDLEREEQFQAAQGGTTISRAMHADYSDIDYTPAYIDVAKKILGIEVRVDKIVEQREYDPVTALADRTLKEFRKWGSLFQAMCITGDSAVVSTNFDGFESLVGTYGRTLSNGLAVPVGGDDVTDQQQMAIEALLADAENVRFFRPDGRIYAYMNGLLKVRWLTVAKKLGYYSKVEYPDPNAVGQVLVDEIIGDKIIIRSIGKDYAGANLLPFTETSSSSSIWFLAWDEEGEGVHFLTSQGLVGEYNGAVGNFYVNNFNMDAVIGCRDTNALVRSTGWKLS